MLEMIRKKLMRRYQAKLEEIGLEAIDCIA
jgi:hypothetical protein